MQAIGRIRWALGSDGPQRSLMDHESTCHSTSNTHIKPGTCQRIVLQELCSHRAYYCWMHVATTHCELDIVTISVRGAKKVRMCATRHKIMHPSIFASAPSNRFSLALPKRFDPVLRRCHAPAVDDTPASVRDRWIENSCRDIGRIMNSPSELIGNTPMVRETSLSFEAGEGPLLCLQALVFQPTNLRNAMKP
jgi:hypothetical protein